MFQRGLSLVKGKSQVVAMIPQHVVFTLFFYEIQSCLGGLWAPPPMNMAWKAEVTSTRFWALSTPTHTSKGDPMTKSVKSNSVKLSSVLVSLAFLTAGASQAMADSGPTMQEKLACRADAQTLCSQFIGKAPQMRACLEQNKAKLSTPCRQVVEAHDG
jgi:hypothetical protein